MEEDLTPALAPEDDSRFTVPDSRAIAEDAEEKAFFASTLPPSAFRLPPSSGYARLEGWERRYQAVLDAFAGRPYVLGENDCFRLTCAMFEALTGIDHWPEFSGRYQTRRESLALIREYADRASEESGERSEEEPL